MRHSVSKISSIALLPLLIAGCNKDNDIVLDNNDSTLRPISSASSPYQNEVYEYLPAPGQFINEPKSGFSADITSPEIACAYALDRLESHRYVSLGAFGGYIVVGFDHSILNRNGSDYDFNIEGNAFVNDHGSTNEPGIVEVMQDTNGNGLPDDTWYELKGSETGAEGTIENYSVTYYRPDGPGKNVKWTDSEGESGTVDYQKAFHTQDYYYPAWIKEDSYTLTGTRLASRTTYDANTGDWAYMAFGWGYADNMGSDAIGTGDADGAGQKNGFKISNAMDKYGNPVNLEYIDFVRVHTAVQSKAGRLGENSCEVFSFRDLNPLFYDYDK